MKPQMVFQCVQKPSNEVKQFVLQVAVARELGVGSYTRYF